MFKKLRRKFIILNMVTVATVLVVALSAVCYVSYQDNMRTLYSQLEDAAQQAAATVAISQFPNSGQSGGEFRDRMPEDDFVPPEIGGRKAASDFPIASYAVTNSGVVSILSSASTGSLSSEYLDQAISIVSNAVASTGYIGDINLCFAKITRPEVTVVSFAEADATGGWTRLATILAGIGALTLGVFYVISLFFSSWALRPAQEAWEQQKRFVADASHDLKTPLTVIGINTSILLDHPDSTIAGMSQWIENTQTEVSQMQDLVGDMLLLAQIDEGAPISRELSRQDLSSMVERQMLELESLAFEREINISSEIEQNLWVTCNESRMRRLITTLVDNASKYAGVGGCVDVSLRRLDGQAVFSVHNDGASISPEDLPHVFDRFYRADKSRTRQEDDQKSHGLGLAIAQAIAQEHGGTITATSSQELGTIFTVTLPLA